MMQWRRAINWTRAILNFEAGDEKWTGPHKILLLW